jgi:hypothetical protein
MNRDGIVDQIYTDRFLEASVLKDQDRIEECLVKAHELLADPAIPRYHYIKTLLLLASATDGWYEANLYCIEANQLWQTTRIWQPAGANDAVDGYMAEIRGELDELIALLEEEGGPEDDVVEYYTPQHDEGVEGARAMLQDMDIGDVRDSARDKVRLAGPGDDVRARQRHRLPRRPSSFSTRIRRRPCLSSPCNNIS